MVETKRAYRYRVTASSGCLAEQAKVGSHVIDWAYFGRGHTWTVYNMRSGEVTGAMTGVYVDKGHETGDGKFVADNSKPLASTTDACLQASPSSVSDSEVGS